MEKDNFALMWRRNSNRNRGTRTRGGIRDPMAETSVPASRRHRAPPLVLPSSRLSSSSPPVCGARPRRLVLASALPPTLPARLSCGARLSCPSRGRRPLRLCLAAIRRLLRCRGHPVVGRPLQRLVPHHNLPVVRLLQISPGCCCPCGSAAGIGVAEACSSLAPSNHSPSSCRPSSQRSLLLVHLHHLLVSSRFLCFRPSSVSSVCPSLGTLCCSSPLFCGCSVLLSAVIFK